MKEFAHWLVKLPIQSKIAWGACLALGLAWVLVTSCIQTASFEAHKADAYDMVTIVNADGSYTQVDSSDYIRALHDADAAGR